MISEELLSEILDTEVKAVELWNNNTIRYFAPKDYIINIYELAHKCKEWGRDKYSIEISSALQRNDSPTYWKGPAVATIGNKTWSANTEPEAISKACEWILKETK